MTSINRFSSRRQRLDHAFLSARLKNAISYKRIAGYFRSSIFELVGEEIEGIPKVQIVCNRELDAADVSVSKHVRETSLKERWNEASPEVEALLHRDRYRKLYELLYSGRVEIRVVPRDRVFIHGKAGVIEAPDGTKTCFLDSINETKSGFAENYDIFGGLPDTIDDDWIESVEKLEEMMDRYIHLRQKARDVFEMRYQETIDPDANRWELCSRVLARRDVIDRLSEPW